MTAQKIRSRLHATAAGLTFLRETARLRAPDAPQDLDRSLGDAIHEVEAVIRLAQDGDGSDDPRCHCSRAGCHHESDPGPRIERGDLRRHLPSGRMVEVLHEHQPPGTSYAVRWLDGLPGSPAAMGEHLEPASPGDPLDDLMEAAELAPWPSPLAELTRGLPPGTRLTFNIELPYEREDPVLHSTYDPEADE